MRSKIAHLFIESARASLLLHIVLAAAIYGLTRESGIRFFNWSMGATFVVWALGWCVRGRWPKIGFLLPFFAISLLLLGGFVTICALWDPSTGEEMSGPPWLADFAFRVASFDLANSVAASVRTAVLLGALLITVDLFTDPKWSRGVLLTAFFTSCGVVGYFFLQKIAPATFELVAIDGNNRLSFATYRYWGNAASFLNLMWPVLAGVAFQMCFTKAKGWSVWLAGSLVVFASLYVNLSKAGQVLGAIGLLGVAIAVVWYLFRNGRDLLRKLTWPVILAGAIPILLVLAFLPFAMPWGRWSYMLDAGVEGNDRTLAYRYFVHLLPDAGWTGFGPGTFKLVYMQYFGEEAVFQRTPFWVAHQDYIQTVVEWGYVGTLLWALIFLPSVLALLIGALRKSSAKRPETFGYEFGMADRLRGLFQAIPTGNAPLVQAGALIAISLTALHATIDFPMQIESLQFYFLIWIALGWRNLLDRQRIKEVRED